MNNNKISSIINKSYPPLNSIDTVKTAFDIMQQQKISSVIITDNQNRPIGIFTEHDALSIIAINKQTNVSLSDVMSKNVFCVDGDSYIHDAYILMEQKNYRHIIITDKENFFLGVVTEGDFLRHMGFEDMAQEKTISDIMSESILTISPNTSIKQAAQLMSEKKCDYAIIIHGGKPKDIVTERDITHFCSLRENNSEDDISVISKHKMYTVNKEIGLKDASNLMQQHGVHQLIVINDKQDLIGLITRHDILKAMHGDYFDFLIATIDAKSKNEKLLKRQKDELEKLANYDLLTNLPNRLLFKKILQKSIANAVRHNYYTACILLDLDRFKDINDSYGHTVGDELLKKISDVLKTSIREGDIVARLGGDEFGIILEHIQNDEDIACAVNKILKNVQKSFTLSNSAEISIEASAGVVVIPKDSQDVEKLFQYADSALYQAKKDGHGLYRFYTDEMTQNAIQKIAYENALRLAIENEDLEVYYQPQVHMKTDKIIGAEALLRWKHGEEMIPPSLFIPIADETGLINTLGEWVLNKACKQGKVWLDNGYHITVAVNISSTQIRYQNIPELVSKVLVNTQYSPEKLEIEITESSLMQRDEENVKMLHALRAKGIRIAIDDFGTGYSSLAYLKRFPIDVLKIDKSFVDDLPYEKEDMAIVVAIIEMAKALGFQVIAEGTEHQEQLDFLKEKGCNIYQGYIKSKPIPAHEFEKLLEEQNA